MEPETTTKHRHYLLPAIVLLVAVVLRVAYFAEIVHDPAFSHPIYDPEYNDHWARGIATGDWTPPPGVNDPEITSTPHGRPPGYPWFLSAIYIIFGVNDYAPRLVQMTLGVINALLLYFIGKRLFGTAVGFVAGLFMATYWVFPYFEGMLTYPVLAVFLLLCLILTLERWLHNSMLRWAAVAGALLGCFALLRPNVLLFAPVLALWMAGVLWQKRVHCTRILLSLSVLAAACIVVLCPAFIRNYIVAKDVVFISSYGGINLYVGNHPDASLVEPRIPELMELAGIENWTCFDYPTIVRGIAARQGKEYISFSDANQYFYDKAFTFIRKQPGVFLNNLFKKSLLFWGPYEITNDSVMEYDKHFSPLLRFLPGFPWFAALFFFGSGVVLCSDRTHRPKNVAPMILLLWLYTGTYFLSVILYFVAGRYRVPIIPVMLLFGAVGIVSLATSIKRKELQNVALGFVTLVLLAVLFHWNPTGYIPTESTWHLRIAMAYTAAGEDDKAEAEYQEALELGASSSIVYANLGRLHIARGKRDEGIALYQEGLRQNPHNAVIHNNLGFELYQAGNLTEAAEHFDQAVQANPRFALAHINLANTLYDLGDVDKALSLFHQAATISPEDAAIPYNIARILFAEGKYEEAAEHYEEALVLRPGFAEALNNLGYLYAIQGKRETAIPYYRKAIANAPDFLLAYNNLGNALFEIGDIGGAAEAYKQALDQKADDIFSLYNMGRIFATRQEWDSAISYITLALDIQPDYVPALTLLATVFLNNNDSDKAIAPLEKAIELRPDDPDILLLLGEALEQTGNTNAALKVYDAALQSLIKPPVTAAQ